MRVLTYKRTHAGDPNSDGIFGIHDCMGSVRAWRYDAVVGVGSLYPWEGSEGIAGKVTWVGIHPYKISNPDNELRRSPCFKFKQFILLDENGPNFSDLAPNLAKRFYVNNARVVLKNYSPVEEEEILFLIKEIINQHKQEIQNVNPQIKMNKKKCQRRCKPKFKRCR